MDYQSLDYYIYKNRLILGIQIGDVFLIASSYCHKRINGNNYTINGMGITRLKDPNLDNFMIIPTEDPGILINENKIVEAFPIEMREGVFREELQLFINIYHLWFLEKVPLDYLNLAKQIALSCLPKNPDLFAYDVAFSTLQNLGGILL